MKKMERGRKVLDKKWKVVLADDETIIREGIRESIDWTGLHLELCGEASDGEEAFEICLEQQADILLVDINMPIMNGIEVVRRLKESHGKCKVVIISGHDEFNYAQEAIRLGVTEYILKPVTPVQLNKILSNIKAQLLDELQQEKFVKLASNQIEQNIPLLRERFFMNWLRDGMAEGEVVEQLAFLRLPITTPKQIIIVRCSELLSNQLFTENDRQLLLFSIENIVSELMGARRFAVLRNLNEYVVAISWDQLMNEQILEMEKTIQHYLKVGITIKAENVIGSLIDVPVSYRQVIAALTSETQISPVAKRARQCIQEMYADKEVTLEKIADMIHISPIYLSRLIKQEFGTTFVSLVTQARIQKAVQLLNTTDMSVNEIAELCGYDTQHYFSTTFKKMMGVSPNQYRKG
jgi:two-component system response regulator YesN